MANTGFPPSNTISPQIRFSERDLSFVPTEQSFHRAGIVGFASKGPINTPTLIQTKRALYTTFGYPHPESGDPYLIYASELYLSIANELYVVRVAETTASNDEAAATAEKDVDAAGGKVIIQSDTAGDYTLATDQFFRWRLNGTLATKVLVVLAGTYTCDELVEALNDQLTPAIDGIQFVNNSDKVAVESVYAYGTSSSIELVSVTDSIYGPTSVIGLGLGMTAAAITGSETKYPDNGYQTDGNYDFTGLSDLNLEVVIDGTNNVNIDNVVQVIDLAALEGAEYTVAQVVSEINTQIASLPGGFEAVVDGNSVKLQTLHVGRDAKLLVKSSSTAEALFGFAATTNAGGSTPTSAVTGTVNVVNAARITGTANTSDISFTLYADSPGTEGNNSEVVITTNVDGTFNIEVFNNDDQVESWGPLTKDQTSNYYVETYINRVSSFLTISDNTAVTAPPASGTYVLTGGTDGIPADPDDQDTLLMGSAISKTGLYSISDPEQVDIDLLAVPGHSSTNVVTELIKLCEEYRRDCLAIIDPPFALTVQEVTEWHNGVHPLNNTRFNSNFAALFWPWLKYRDSYNKVDVWIPPSCGVIAAIARSDQLSAPWIAPAGLTRGVIPGITGVYTEPSLAERDTMYGNRNAVNVIAKFANSEDFIILGQKTLQRTPTALNRINVRRMLLVAQKRILVACRPLLFEPNDVVFRQRFIDIATGILENIKIGRGLYDYIIQADEELNTADVIDRNEFRARIGIQPSKAVEFMFIEFSLHRTGSFTENADNLF